MNKWIRKNKGKIITIGASLFVIGMYINPLGQGEMMTMFTDYAKEHSWIREYTDNWLFDLYINTLFRDSASKQYTGEDWARGFFLAFEVAAILIGTGMILSKIFTNKWIPWKKQGGH